MSDNRIVSQQLSPTSQADSQNFRAARGTRTGETFTADWKRALLLEGRVFQMTIGTITAGGDVSLITGGGAGTIVDQDQPEFGVSVLVNTTLIPLEIHIACQVDLDADAEVGNIIVAVDTAAAYAGDGTVTTEVPLNVLTGDSNDPVGTVATAFSAATADITDPTVSAILDYKTVRASQITAASVIVVELKMDYEPVAPFHIRGPGAFYGYWGGTAAVPGIATVTWAEVPTSRFS